MASDERDVGQERERLAAVIERDRHAVAVVLENVRSALRSYRWLLEGRGPYEWDDERYRDEFERARTAVEVAIEPLAKIARDMSDSPQTEAARAAALLRSAEQPREVPEANAKLAKALRRMAEQVSPFRAQGLMQMAADVLERAAQPREVPAKEGIRDVLGYERFAPGACQRCGYQPADCTCPVGPARAAQPQAPKDDEYGRMFPDWDQHQPQAPKPEAGIDRERLVALIYEAWDLSLRPPWSEVPAGHFRAKFYDVADAVLRYVRPDAPKKGGQE